MLTAQKLLSDFRMACSLPHVEICLMRTAAYDNHLFFGLMVDWFYREAMRRHPKFPLIRNLQYGVALSELAVSTEDYLAKIESSARRNVKKAIRNGYTFSRIDYNEWLQGITEIHRSTAIRQGVMPSSLLNESAPPIQDPPSRDFRHDYLYFGIFREDKLCAYSGCMVAGELLSIGTLYGHFEHQPNGVVPLLLVDIVDYCRQNHGQVRYYMYDKFFGAGETMRRFKRKFNFQPHKVTWVPD